MRAVIKACASDRSQGCSRYASACKSGWPDLSRKGRSGNARPNLWRSSLVQWRLEFAKASRRSNLELLNLVPTLHYYYFPAITRQFWLDGSNSKVQTWSIRIRLLYARASTPPPPPLSTRPHDNTTWKFLSSPTFSFLEKSEKKLGKALKADGWMHKKSK